MNKKNKKFALLLTTLVLLCANTNIKAQTAIDNFSPYTLFGLGHIERGGDQNSLAMGGIGVGNRDNSIINLLNPAAVTAREDRAFMLDFGLQQKNMLYSEGDKKSANNLFNIHHVVASFPIYKQSAFKVGVMPYSAVGYNFTEYDMSDDLLANIGAINYIKSGQGSISQMFVGAGITLFDRLSLGADFIAYWGNIGRYSNTSFTSTSYYRTLTRSWEFVARGNSVKFGLQYEQPISDAITLTVGATYNPGTVLKGEKSAISYAISNSYTDTIEIVDNSKFAGYNIPSEVSVGFTLRKTDNWMIGFDYTRQDWTKTTFDATPNIDFKTSVAESFNLGMEFTPNKYDVRYYFSTVTYRLGAYYNKTYMMVNNHQLNNLGVTFGVSLPVYNRTTSVAFGVDIGQMGTSNNNLVKEKYIKFNLGLNLFDLWFFKTLYN